MPARVVYSRRNASSGRWTHGIMLAELSPELAGRVRRMVMRLQQAEVARASKVV